jgi:chemotaxis signal transduction protein
MSVATTRTSAPEPTAPLEAVDHIVFRLGEQRYAVPVGKIVELDKPPTCVVVPNTPAFVLGVTNVRGDILSVIDLRAILGISRVARTDAVRLLTIRSADGEMRTGLIVDSLQGMRSVTEATLRALQNHGEVDAPVSTRAFDDKDGEVRVFDVDRFFEFPDIKKLTGR